MKKVFSIGLLISIALLLSACQGNVPAATKLIEPKELWTTDDPVWGKETAPITMVLFSDFQCPYCAELFVSLKNLEKDWINNGKLKIQLRDFPLSMHANSLDAHLTANAAAKQGKYLEMHEVLFEKQAEWQSISNPKAIFRDYAKKIGLNLEEYDQIIIDPALTKEIFADKDHGLSAGITGTPGFSIQEVIYDEALSYDELLKILLSAEKGLQ